ncbi:MAG: hypothetical protein J0H42_12500 [Rhizobiales bacterium]|nr:hypothetical protein [Hyphomicrobiales bacterium]
MQGPVDKQPRDNRSAYRNWDIKLFALPVLLAAALIGFVVSHPGVSKWVADAVQAEFAGTDIVPDATPPTRVAGPKSEIRTVKLN